MYLFLCLQCYFMRIFEVSRCFLKYVFNGCIILHHMPPSHVEPFSLMCVIFLYKKKKAKVLQQPQTLNFSNENKTYYQQNKRETNLWLSIIPNDEVNSYSGTHKTEAAPVRSEKPNIHVTESSHSAVAASPYPRKQDWLASEGTPWPSGQSCPVSVSPLPTLWTSLLPQAPWAERSPVCGVFSLA